MLKRLKNLSFVIITSALPSLTIAATSSTDIILSSPSPATILLMESGLIDWPSSSSLEHTFSTTKSCPANFTKYIELIPTKVWGKSTQILGAFGACVSNVSGSGPYTVTYYAIRRYGTFTFTYYAGDDHLWVSHTKGIFADNTMEKIPNIVSGFNTTYSADYGSPGGIQWKLYCYPDSIAPPNVGAGCTTTAPYT